MLFIVRWVVKVLVPSASLTILQFLIAICILVIANVHNIHGERSRYHATHTLIVASHGPLIEVVVVVPHRGMFVLVEVVTEP
jgi:hypothetical protein